MEQINEVIRSILEVAPFGIFIVNGNGGIDYANSAMLIMAGQEHDEFQSRNIFQIAEYKQLGVVDRIKQVIEGGSFSLEALEFQSQASGKIMKLRP